MRIERTGGPPDLEKAFHWFVETVLGGRSLDDNRDVEAAEGKFPDFACFRDLVLIEMKTLKADQSDRLNDVIEQNIDPEEKPIFFGTRDGASVLKNVSNGDNIQAKIFDKLTNTVTNHLSKASRQFADYRARKKPKNSVSICVILNSQQMEFTPQMVAAVIQRRMNVAPKDGQPPRFHEIDAVVYISEKHVTRLKNGMKAFGIVVFYGAGIKEQPWKEQFVHSVIRRWSDARTDGGFHSDQVAEPFVAVEDIPEKITNGESVRLAYRRNPIFRSLSNSDLRVRWNRNVALGMLSFVKGSWKRPSPKETLSQTQEFDCLIEETNFRGIDLREFAPAKLNEAERAIVLDGLPLELCEMFPKCATSTA